MASIYASLASLLFNDKYSDLMITCGGRTFRAHRAIVCPQTAFFAKACDGSFKVPFLSRPKTSRLHRHTLLTRPHVQESISGVIDLPDDDPYILERFLQFLYTGTYEDGEYPALNMPSLAATMTPEEVQAELNQAPGIDFMGVSGSIQEGGGWNREGDEVYEEEDEEEGEEEEDDDDDEDDDEEEEAEEEEADIEGALPQSYRTDWPHSLFTSLRVYVMADKFDVPALKLLARKRFYRTAEKIYVTCEDFPAVVDEMYRSTPPNDSAMRGIPCRLIAAQYYEERALRERFEPVMREHGDLAVGVLNYMTYLLGFGHLPFKDDVKTSV
ncbi:MAG: hypothetical protein M1813_003788 [Trichoglossum hirsutum]|nr:MAG: hypothetical protein M1813_003788 [Trichoglossum hirsutum]